MEASAAVLQVLDAVLTLKEEAANVVTALGGVLISTLHLRPTPVVFAVHATAADAFSAATEFARLCERTDTGMHLDMELMASRHVHRCDVCLGYAALISIIIALSSAP